ncbi:tRNA (guanine-N7)-methyltransferase [Helicobacter pullorum]|uniref:tRNA (guanine-N(7)-)-methyltransferase n=1 Tax=Helicobacter pullorum TaxID=35818 RepID=A0A0N1ECG7_9HELI|nr:tRNA (guanosine(46)-N7)-methyltransferase TrmB [Helicobacter pullorum]KPH56155.1 tRNA (guanine-N7)-methyltransferase [Helicobacter pullorum]
MPHFKTQSLTLPPLPFTSTTKEGEFTFTNLFTSANNPNFLLLQVHFSPTISSLKNKDYFLEIKKTNHETIVKCDKNSKIAPIGIIKKSLEILSQFQDSLLTHNLHEKNNLYLGKIPFIKHIEDFLDFDTLLKKQNLKNPKVWLEIGFGSGRHLLYNAQKYPNILHIGLEIHYPSLEQVARQIELTKLDNILLLAYDARIFLELLPSNTLEKIFVHFPVPWDKKPHRRIFSNAFLSQASRVLIPNGHLQLRTDSYEYFCYAKDLAASNPNLEIQYTSNAQEEIISKYEARWLKQQKNIYNLEIFAKQSSSPISFDYTFDFSNTSLQKFFQKKKIIQEDYFLHLEDLLIADSTDCKLLKIAFGDFNYPETRYLIEDTHLHYFRENPLPTQINHKAHQLLISLLNQKPTQGL